MGTGSVDGDLHPHTARRFHRVTILKSIWVPAEQDLKCCVQALFFPPLVPGSCGKHKMWVIRHGN